MKKLIMIVFAILIIISCKNTRQQAKINAPIFDNLGKHTLDISTRSELGQKLFNQGLNLSYGFNHAEAARAFREAIKLDPAAPMNYWGLALVLGPNLNAPMDPSSLGEVYIAVQNAMANRKNGTAWEKAMVEAIAVRYPDSVTTDRAEFDAQYAEAMGKVYEQFPDIADVAALYGEALMDVHPWDLYTYEGQPKKWTPQIVDHLANTLKKWPEHPGANHFYIHAVEASTTPDRAIPNADMLTDLVPGSGHLVHMPSHIYIRTGKYHEGSLVNENAIIADSIYVAMCQTQGIYPLLYYPHNIHFLAATAALEGRGDRSISASWQLAKRIDKEIMKDPEWATLQHFYSIPYFTLVKFGQWNRILEIPDMTDEPYYPKAIERYARGMAYANQGDLEAAEAALETLRTLRQEESIQELTIFGLNLMVNVMRIAENVLAAEIHSKKGAYDKAITLLYEAIEIEDHLIYNEPPDWFFSVRHHLGPILLEAGKFEEAEEVYRKDLKNLPKNGWALNGLYQSMEQQGKKEEAKAVRLRFDEAWQWANIELQGSLVAQNSYNNYDDHDLFKKSIALNKIQSISNCGL